MAQTFLNINEAAELTDKSVQTIRRAIKSKRIKARKRKTPQGYNYMVDKDSLKKAYEFVKKAEDKKKQGKAKSRKGKISKTPRKLQKQYLTQDDIGVFKDTIKKLVDQHEKDKENLFRLIKSFQDRIVVLENQVKLLEQPAKKWYQFWK
jgi:hypothetical protein